jgi:hypothetical protein
MGIVSRADWLKAQELLVGLVQALNPVVQGIPSSSLVLTKKIFIPPKDALSMPQTARPVQKILPVLLQARKEVAQLIQVLEEATVEPEAKEKKGEVAKPIPNRVVPSPVREVGKVVPKALSFPIQKAIFEVRSVIQALSSSAYLEQPKANVLQTALKKIRPVIEQLIDAVEMDGKSEEMEKDSKKHLFRFGIPKEMRKPLERIPRQMERVRNEVPLLKPLANRKAEVLPGKEKPVLQMGERKQQTSNPAQKLPLPQSQMALPERPANKQMDGETPRIMQQPGTPIAAPYAAQFSSETRRRKKRRTKFPYELEKEEDPDKNNLST